MIFTKKEINNSEILKSSLHNALKINIESESMRLVLLLLLFSFLFKSQLFVSWSTKVIIDFYAWQDREKEASWPFGSFWQRFLIHTRNTFCTDIFVDDRRELLNKQMSSIVLENIYQRYTFLYSISHSPARTLLDSFWTVMQIIV